MIGSLKTVKYSKLGNLTILIKGTDVVIFIKLVFKCTVSAYCQQYKLKNSKKKDTYGYF